MTKNIIISIISALQPYQIYTSLYISDELWEDMDVTLALVEKYILIVQVL